MKTLVNAFCVVALSGSALGQSILVDQPMAPNGGVMRQSQFWIDPSGENDSDNDARIWEDFQFTRPTTITHLRWWGQTVPPLGFDISFWNQDPNTVAYQPDILHGAYSERTYPNVSSASVGGNLYQFDVDLAVPESFDADTRYFVSITGRETGFSTSWYWAQSYSGMYGSFWWIRGAHMYFHLGDNRALQILGPATCAPDLNSDGTLDFFDVQAFLAAFAAHDSAADFTHDGLFDFFDVQAFLQAFAAGCP